MIVVVILFRRELIRPNWLLKPILMWRLFVPLSLDLHPYGEFMNVSMVLYVLLMHEHDLEP